MLTEAQTQELIAREFRCTCRHPEMLDSDCHHHAVAWLVREIYGQPHPPVVRRNPSGAT